MKQKQTLRDFAPDSWYALCHDPRRILLLRFEIDWRFDGNYPRLGLVVYPGI